MSSGLLLADGRPAPRPAAVILDLDDTLYDYAPAHRAGLVAMMALLREETGVVEARFHSAYAEARSRVKARLGAVAAAHSRLLYAHQMLEDLGMRTQPALALSLEAAYWRAFLLESRAVPGVERFLLSLRFHGITVAVVTNLTLAIQLRKLIHLRLAELVDHLVASEEAGSDKASGAAFTLVQDRMGLPGSATIWSIGDDRADIQAVKSVFPNATGVLRLTADNGALVPLADAVIHDFEGLALEP